MYYNNYFGGPIFLIMIFLICILSIIFIIVPYIISAITLYNLAKYENINNAWFAFIPYLNWIIVFDALNIPRWYFLGFLVTFIPYIGSILIWFYVIYLYYLLYKLFEKYDIDRVCYFIGLFIPFVMIVPYIQLNNKIKNNNYIY